MISAVSFEQGRVECIRESIGRWTTSSSSSSSSSFSSSRCSVYTLSRLCEPCLRRRAKKKKRQTRTETSLCEHKCTAKDVCSNFIFPVFRWTWCLGKYRSNMLIVSFFYKAEAQSKKKPSINREDDLFPSLHGRINWLDQLILHDLFTCK